LKNYQIITILSIILVRDNREERIVFCKKKMTASSRKSSFRCVPLSARNAHGHQFVLV